MATFSIRREPGIRSTLRRERHARQYGFTGFAPRTKQVAVIEAVTQREALEKWEEQQDALGWHTLDDGTGYEWRSAGIRWNEDDGFNERRRDWRLTLRYRDQHRATYLAWKV